MNTPSTHNKKTSRRPSTCRHAHISISCDSQAPSMRNSQCAGKVVGQDDFFSKEMSVMMAGFAVLLMMTCHFFMYPHWLTAGVNWSSSLGYAGKITTELMGTFGGICVRIFALMSGYALMMNPKAYGTWRKRFRRLFKFLFAYWMVNALFLIIGYLNGDTMPGINELFFNMLGLKTGPHEEWINVPFAWYVCYYIEFVLLTPILLWGFGSNRKVLDMAMAATLVIIVYICRRIPCEVTNSLFPLLSTILGILIAKYKIFDKLQRIVTGRLNWAILVSGIALLIIIRYEVGNLNSAGGANWNFFMQIFLSVMAAVLILFSVEIFYRIHDWHIKNCLLLLGSLSMYLWFLHGIFFTGKNFMQPFIYSVREPILILILSTIVLLPVAWLLKGLQNIMDNRFLTNRNLKSFKQAFTMIP